MDNVLTVEGNPSSKFNIFTGILKAEGGDGEPMTLSGVASSTVEDLHGDFIERTALKDMERQVQDGLTIFLNHSYQVPEDVAGYTESAKIRKAGEDAQGNAVWDLDMDITINDENPRAIEAWRGIRKKGAKVGLSIGANIPPGGFDVDRKTGAKTIRRINLLETSIVGIPANPRSWISKAVEITPPVMEEDGLFYVANLTTPTLDAVEEVKAEELEEAPPADDREEDAAVANETSPDQPDTEQADSEPEADGDPGPDVSDSDEPGTEEVAPLEGDADPVLAAIESLDEVQGAVTPTHLQMAVDIAQALAKQNATLRTEKDEALRKAEAAERERDETARKAQAVIASTTEIVHKLGNMPVGRKAVLEEQKQSLRHLEGTYGSDFMKMLE